MDPPPVLCREPDSDGVPVMLLLPLFPNGRREDLVRDLVAPEQDHSATLGRNVDRLGLGKKQPELASVHEIVVQRIEVQNAGELPSVTRRQSPGIVDVPRVHRAARRSDGQLGVESPAANLLVLLFPELVGRRVVESFGEVSDDGRHVEEEVGSGVVVRAVGLAGEDSGLVEAGGNA